MNAPVSVKIDTRGLEAAILEVVPETRRTVAEQCVTSMGMILQDAQNWTTYVDIGRMDAELDAPAESEELAKLGFTEGDAIVLARANPESNFNKITGGRWALTLPKTASIAGFGRAYGKMNAVQMFLKSVIQPIKERMRAARHSSGHFLQAGYKPAIQFCVTSPLFKNIYRSRSIYAPPNELNELDAGKLGHAENTPPDRAEFSITAENNVGQDGSMGGGNDILDAKHRQALFDHSQAQLEEAVEKERGVQVAELARRLDLKYAKFNKMLA